MQTPLEGKSTSDEIRARFEADVERFSQLETGQTSTMDAVLVMDLLTQAAVGVTHPIRRILDVGCGAGNFSLKLRHAYGADFDVDLVDLSQAMADRACQRVSAACAGAVRSLVGDFRTVDLPARTYDVILAGAVLHHLRDEGDWQAAFAKLYKLLAPGGSLWIADLVTHEMPAVDRLMWQRYGHYLTDLEGPEYRDRVFAYIDKEDSPRPVTYQLDLLRQVGFDQVDLLHKNATFAALGALRRS